MGGSAAPPLLPRSRPRGAPATPHLLSPPTRSLAAAVPGSPGRDTAHPRTPGAAPRPPVPCRPLPGAERPLPRPCASAGAGAGRGAVAAREEG